MAETRSKKLINEVKDCERENSEGLVAVNPGLRLVEGFNVVVRADANDVVSSGKVAIISGGGSGHEPGHAGYTGKGMLTASACGSVFTSPPPKTIMAAIDAVCHGQTGCEVLMIVTNYTGDRLNFGIACERARVKGVKTEMVVVGEDCALDSVDLSAGRRGLAGTIFIHKIAGAMSELGKQLGEITNELNRIKAQMGTIGLSLSSCSLPGCGPMFSLKHDEMELGLGVHGEAGVRRIKLQTARDTVHTMMDHMTNVKTKTHIDIKAGDRVAVLINNLGGTSVLELNIIAKEAITYIESKGVNVERAYCGAFLTSLEMAGISITILHIDDTITSYLDFPTDAPGWKSSYLPPGMKIRKTPATVKVTEDTSVMADSCSEKLDTESATRVHQCIQKACDTLVGMEETLNDLDRQSGDGDCGSTVARGAKAILSSLGLASNPGLPVDCPHLLALSLGQATEDSMGGSSGALYSLFFTGVAKELKSISGEALSAGWKSGLDAIMRYGGARPGQRTMIDPLHASWECFHREIQTKSVSEALKMAAEAAKEAAEATVAMDAQAGRASYVNKELLTKPDPGAMAVASWLQAVAHTL